MIDFLKTINQILTWRIVSVMIIPVLLLMSISDSSIADISVIGFCGIIASVLSLRGQEGDS